MATPTTAPAAAPDTEPKMCLLHGDFHPMEQACWSVTLDFYLDHQDVPQQQARDCYLTAVERKMLDNLIRNSR